MLTLGSQHNSDDVIESVFNDSIQKSKEKIEAFLEDKSYVMKNRLPSFEDTGFV